MTRLEWVRISSDWYKLIDHENQKDWWSVKYRSYNRAKIWQVMYPTDSWDKNHAVPKREITEDQLRRNLEMEYLLTREV